MASGRRIVTLIVAGLGVIILSWVLVIGTVYAWGGVMTVKVQDREDNFNLYLPIPMAVVEAAVATTDWVLDEEDLLQIHADVDLGEWAPMVRELLDVLEDCPDVTFVEVEDDSDWVRISKKRGKLIVEVEEPAISIRVSIPTRSIARTVHRLTS